jgi:hypothetical protein
MEDKEKLMKKWAPILDSMGVTGSKANWMAEYAQLHQNKESKRDERIDSILENTLATEHTSMEFPSFLPIAMRVASKTIGQDIVSVKPMDFNSEEELERIKNEVKQENRDRKIDSLVEGGDFEEMNVEEHPDYKSGPTGKLFYLDYQYGGTQSI